MRRPLFIAIALVFAAALLARAITYTVRFTEEGVLTTFGKAVDTDVAKMGESGLKFKWPDPIQSVTKYDKRQRLLQTKIEQQQTADNRQIAVEAFCTWKVKDPLKFFQKFSNAGDRADDHYVKAERVLSDNLRAAMGEISKFRMDELFTVDAKASKLGDLENRVLATLRAGVQEGGNLDEYGIEVSMVGVNRIVLPEETTKAVFESMKQERKRLVDQIESKGDSEAQTIISRADNNAKKILSFAQAYAAEIRRQGDMEAEQYVRQMNESPELAVFLKNMEFVRGLVASRITAVFDPNVAGFGFMNPMSASKGRIHGIEPLMEKDPGRTVPRASTGGSGTAPPSASESGERQ